MDWLFSLSLGALAGVALAWYMPWSLFAGPAAPAREATQPLHEKPIIRQFSEALAPVLRRAFPGIVARLNHMLVEAGRPDNGVDAARFVAARVIGAAVAAVNLAVPAAIGMITWKTAILGMVIAVIVFAGISVYSIKDLHDKRRKKLDQQFPDFLDFVLMLKEAGETLSASLHLYVINNPDLELAEHIRRVVAGLDTHKDGLPGAVMEFHHECASELGQTTLLSILKAEEMGARAAVMLREVALDMRQKRYEVAEKKAEALKSSSMFPAVVMFMGAFLALLAGSLGTLFSGI